MCTLGDLALLERSLLIGSIRCRPDGVNYNSRVRGMMDVSETAKTMQLTCVVSFTECLHANGDCSSHIKVLQGIEDVKKRATSVIQEDRKDGVI